MKKLFTILLLALPCSLFAGYHTICDFEGSGTSDIGDTTTPIATNSPTFGEDDRPVYENGERQGVDMCTPSDDWVAGSGSGGAASRDNITKIRHAIRQTGVIENGHMIQACSGDYAYWTYINAFDTNQKQRVRSQITGSPDPGGAAPGGSNLKFDTTYWQTIATDVPDDFLHDAENDTNTFRLSLFDYHGAGISQSAVPLALGLRRKVGGGAIDEYEWILITDHCDDADPNKTRATCSNNDTDVYVLGDVVLGSQNKIILQFNLGWTDGGQNFFKGWLNGDVEGSPSVNVVGHNAHNSDIGPSTGKFGIYNFKLSSQTRTDTEIAAGLVTGSVANVVVVTTAVFGTISWSV